MTKSILTLLAISIGLLLPACNDSHDDTQNAGGAGGASNACPLPPSALISTSCVACIKTECPATYTQLCAADCAANEYGSACLGAQREIGTCLSSSQCAFACGATHGSAYVGGASGLFDPGMGGRTANVTHPGLGGDSGAAGDSAGGEGGASTTSADGGATSAAGAEARDP